MKALVRLCAVLVTALPTQLWVTFVGLALAALAFVATLLSPVFPKVSVLPAALGTAFVLLCTVFCTGYVFRALAAPHTHRLVPYFRATLLAAALVIVTLASLLWLAFWARWADPFAGHVVSLIASFVLAFTALSVAVWLMFFFTGGPLRMLGFAAVAFAVGPLIRGISPPAEIRIELLGVALAAIAAWAVFGAWFLRARRVLPVIWLTPSRSLERLDERRAPVAMLENPANAVRVLLTGRTEQSVRDRLIALLVVIGIVAVVIRFAHGRAYNDAVIVATMSLAGAFSAAIVGLRAASGARRLWLRGGRSRSGLFRACEREVLIAAATFVATFVAAVALLLLTNAAWEIELRALLPFGVAVFLGGYVGLASIRRVGALDWLAIVVLVVAGSAAAYVSASGLAAPLTSALVGGQLVFTAGYRMLARHRWRTIDWLEFRPPLPALFAPRRGARREHA